MTYGCNAIEIETGNVVHITGTYQSKEDMEEALLENGYIVTKWWEVK